MPKKSLFVVNDIDFMIKVYDLAKSRGKKTGDSVQAEFDELLQIDPGAVSYLGDTDAEDADMLTGNMREAGLKVTNMNEIERQKNLGGKNES